MQIFFTYLLIPIVVVAVPVFWLGLRRDALRLAFVIGTSLVLLGLLNPAFAVISVALIVATHQLVEQMRAHRLAVGRTVLIAVLGAIVILAVGKYSQPMVRSLWGTNDWVYTRVAMPLGVSYF
ncbi:MAG TPA: hypothetical protein VL117_12430, partial [Thermoleophilia bacterium]|nr:hypothetical protein [Thermoleophilia bacterium]